MKEQAVIKTNTIHLYISAALVALAALAFGPQPVEAAVTEAWVHRFSNVLTNSVDLALKVVRDAAGDIIVTGTSDDNTSWKDMLTIKYSGADGSVIWKQRYNGPESSDDVPNGVAVDANGNVVVTGYSGAGNNPDYYTAKYAAATGALLWDKRYDGGSEDYARAVAVDRSGNVVVTGNSGGDYYTAKYAAADGALLWEKRYSGPANSYNQAAALAVDGNGNVVVTGYSYDYNSSHRADYYTAKYASADGTLLWEKRYNGPANSDDSATAVAVDRSGNVVVTGSSAAANGNSDYYTAKYAAANGALLWEKRYNGPADSADYAYAVAVDDSGNVVVTGRSVGLGQSSYDYYTAKYAAVDGALLWEKRYDGPANDSNEEATALALDGNGNVVVTGSSTSTEISQGWPRIDYYTAKYAAADGALLWEHRYKSLAFATWYPAPGDPPAMVVDGSDSVIVTGPSLTLQGKSDYYTAKYAASDGALLWENNYNNGPVHHESHPDAIAMDRGGNVVVTATSEDNFYAAKSAASDGALLWEKRGAGNILQMVLDGGGNVVVAGSSDGTIGYNDYYTAKYAAADGALLWEKHNRFERPSALALDASGNVVMVGSGGTNAYNDYYTAKYAALDGALLWEKSYNGPANRDDQATAVAVDARGNVVVTGSSQGDYYTAKYAAADGALVWEKRYNGPANRDDQATAVAVDASGNVVVTGCSASGGSIGRFIYDYYTAKYAAVDGTLLWEKRDNDPANANQFLAMAVDGIGNVVVTKISTRSGATLKYAAADGALLWEKRFIDGYATAVAVDDNSNVVVTGNTVSNGDYFYYTAKYAEKDGALLWEKTYKEPGSFWNFANPHNLALGPNGRVAITGTSNLGTSIASDVLTVVYREPLPPISIELAPAGVRLRFAGTPGRSYNIERASAVTGPWGTINTQTAPASGLLEYLDTLPHPGSRFYRTVQP